MRHFRLKRRFQLAIYGLDSFGLLDGIDDQLAALRSIREHLEPGGLLILDVSNGNGRGSEPTDELVLQYDGFDPETGLPLSKWTARSTDHGEQVDHYTYFYDEVGEDRLVRRSRHYPLRARSDASRAFAACPHQQRTSPSPPQPDRRPSSARSCPPAAARLHGSPGS